MPHPELMENALGCQPKQTATIQKETFQAIIKNTVSGDEAVSEKIFTDIQENLNTMIEDYNELYEDTQEAPIALSKEKVITLLKDSGVSEEATAKIEASYEENFGQDLPLAEHLVDAKLLKANAHKKKEEQLVKQVEDLEQKLEQVVQSKVLEDGSESVAHQDPEDTTQQDLGDDRDDDFDVVLHVKPDKLSKIKTDVINGQRCLIVPINDNEHARINGRKDLI